MMSGFIFVTGPVSFSTILTLIFKVALPAALGVTLGSYMVYFIARYGGKFVIEKWGKYIGLYVSDIEKLEARLSGTRKDEFLIGGARILPIVPSVAISAFCGLIEMNVVKYFVISFIGTFIRGIILGAIGWQVGNVYERYANLIGAVEDKILYLIVALVIGFIVFKYIQKKKGEGSSMN
jgi:membrane protein DedA with SNARE-associated domain